MYFKLKENYRFNEDLFFENAAVDKFNGTRELYRLAFCNSSWANAISSFDKAEIQKLIQCGYVKRKSLEERISLPEKEDDYIKTEIVRTVTFEYILNKYNINRIDLLMIDTEGYDFELIKMFPFNILRPRLIIFEHSHFSDEVKNQCNNFLLKNSYKLKILLSDTIALDNYFFNNI